MGANRKPQRGRQGASHDLYPEQGLRQKILEAAFAVHNTLGAGFLEKAYLNALVLELRASGIACEQQAPLRVLYKGTLVGDYVADLVVQGKVLLELKACAVLDSSREAQI
jgi:GxxExxY protein